MAELEPPGKTVELEDAGAHELDSDTDEHFSDASEGNEAESIASKSQNVPIPHTRVERVDEEASFGEVPGTRAYKARLGDSVPDEIEIVAEEAPMQMTSSTSSITEVTHQAVPKTLVEAVDESSEAFLGREGRKRAVDATPDEVVLGPDVARDPLDKCRQTTDEETAGIQSTLPSALNAVFEQPWHDDVPEHDVPSAAIFLSSIPASKPSTVDIEASDIRESDNEASVSETRALDVESQESIILHTIAPNIAAHDDFADFEDFEEPTANVDDFGDFDALGQNNDSSEATADLLDDSISTLAILDFSQLESRAELDTALQPYLDAIFPRDDYSSKEIHDESDATSLPQLSDRSKSLWAQLVAPPPLQPPNWLRSRIRRLFLVSLGVPVDLDEILPASKQKKLVLPSITTSGERSPRPWAQERRLDASAPSYSTSNFAGNSTGNSTSNAVGNSSNSTNSNRRLAEIPEFDSGAASIFCSTTETALQNFTDDELRTHVRHLHELQAQAVAALDYWQKQSDSALGEKEAFEAVIENLVKHAKKARR